jgi:Flp pilus assembly protein TadD
VPRTESPDEAAGQLNKLSNVAHRLEVFDRFRPAFFQPDPTRHTPATGARSREANLHRVRGNELIAVGRPAQAIAPLRQAVVLDPESATAQHDLGLAFLQCDRLREVTGCLWQAIVLQPRLARAHFNLAAALERRGDGGGAIAE